MISIPKEVEFDIEAVELKKSFGRQEVVKGVSFQVQRGSVMGLIGPNGAGKSTTLKMLMQLLRIDSGSAKVLTSDVASQFQDIKLRVGYVPEHHHIYRWMTVGRVIEFTRSFYPTWNDQLCERMVKLFLLDRKKKVKQLSKGMLAKLALLVAVAHEPEVLILDEPLSGLDPIVRDEFLDGLVETICQRQTTVIFSSHTIGDVQRIANTVGVLFDGRLLVHRSIDDLLASTKRLRAVMADDAVPEWIPERVICQRMKRREWLLTIDRFDPSVLSSIRERNNVQHLEAIDLNLEELFKDYILGERARDETAVA